MLICVNIKNVYGYLFVLWVIIKRIFIICGVVLIMYF